MVTCGLVVKALDCGLKGPRFHLQLRGFLSSGRALSPASKIDKQVLSFRWDVKPSVPVTPYKIILA